MSELLHLSWSHDMTIAHQKKDFWKNKKNEVFDDRGPAEKMLF